MADNISWNGVTLSDLNYFMKNYQTGTIIPDQYFWNSLYDVLKANVQKDGFYGDLAEMLIQTSYPFTGTAFGENADIPYPDDLGFTKMWIPLKQVIVNAGISSQALSRATGGSSSWGRAVDRVLQAQRQEFLWLMELCAIGDGTGRLGRVVSATGTTTPVLTLDNTYCDFGWENSALIKPGMWVEFYDANGVQVGDVATTGAASGSPTTDYFQVTAVTFGDRSNGAATTGTVTLATTDNDLTGTTYNFNSNGGVLYLAGSRSRGFSDSAGAGSGSSTVYQAASMQGATNVACSLPMGLVGIVQHASSNTYTDASIDCTLDTFQGLTRSSYGTLNAYMYDGDNFLGGAAGTPVSNWDLSSISDAINVIDMEKGGKVDLLLCSSQLALAINRKMKTDSNFTITVPASGANPDLAFGNIQASRFPCADGRLIPIRVSKTIPRNVLYGLTTSDLRWFVKGGFDFLRLNGQVWDKSYADRKANFEAPYGGYTQLAAERCDRCFCIRDLADDV